MGQGRARRLVGHIERDYIPTEGPRWRRWTVGILAWSVVAPIFLLGAILALGLVALVGAILLAPTLDHADAFTILWAVAVLLAGVGAWLWFWAAEEEVALAVGGLVIVMALVAVAGGAWSSPPTGFCATHKCISNFSDGNGSIVQCADGMWSHSGGLPGACSYHRGER